MGTTTIGLVETGDDLAGNARRRAPGVRFEQVRLRQVPLMAPAGLEVRLSDGRLVRSDAYLA